jgi:hypothetical protein
MKTSQTSKTKNEKKNTPPSLEGVGGVCDPNVAKGEWRDMECAWDMDLGLCVECWQSNSDYKSGMIEEVHKNIPVPRKRTGMVV